jgi:hypothetical protein
MRGELQYLWDARITPDHPWSFNTYAIQQWHVSLSENVGYWSMSDELASVVLPYWVAVLTSTALAVVPWLAWRFSLRTLLVATTVVAVGLGVVVMIQRGS